MKYMLVPQAVCFRKLATGHVVNFVITKFVPEMAKIATKKSAHKGVFEIEFRMGHATENVMYKNVSLTALTVSINDVQRIVIHF